MFHRQTDASKVALVALVERLRADGAVLLDVQWATPHLASLGVVAIPRPEYHRRLAAALDFPRPSAWESRPPESVSRSNLPDFSPDVASVAQRPDARSLRTVIAKFDHIPPSGPKHASWRPV